MHKTFIWKGEEIDTCTCNCHEVGEHWRHFIPCCGVTYQPYMNKGVVDMELLDKALELVYDFRMKQKEKQHGK